MSEVRYELSLEEVRARIQAAGLIIGDDRLEMIRRALSEALAPLQNWDPGKIRALEPAVTFTAD